MNQNTFIDLVLILAEVKLLRANWLGSLLAHVKSSLAKSITIMKIDCSWTPYDILCKSIPHV